MSLSSSRVGYRHRCVIERNGAGTDAWGDSNSPGWATHLSAVPCRAWTNGGTEPVNDERTAVVEDRRISLVIGTDVTERDRIASVTDQGGNTIFEGPMTIEAVLRHTDHLEVLVERVR
jgi:hypothetical protein